MNVLPINVISHHRLETRENFICIFHEVTNCFVPRVHNDYLYTNIDSTCHYDCYGYKCCHIPNVLYLVSHQSLFSLWLPVMRVS